MIDLATLSFAGGPALAGTTPLVIACLVIAALLVARLLVVERRHARLARRLTTAEAALAGMDEWATAAAADVQALREKLEALDERHSATATVRTGPGVRQAIALSRYGATTRQLVDTCGLSQGEAHLVQSLYGRQTTGVPNEATL